MAAEKILVVDDVEIVCIHIEEELTDAGYDVRTALSGREAIEIAEKEKIDLAFVDLVMPEMDGVDVCKRLKKINPDTIVVLMSGHPKELEEKKDAFLAAGGRDGFLRKPFMEGELLEITKKLLAEKSK